MTLRSATIAKHLPRLWRLALLVLWGAPVAVHAAVAVVPLYGNGMVIQRDRPFPVRGTAAPNKTITVAYNGLTNSTTADAQGRWEVSLPAMPARTTGGNFTISETGGNTLTFVNVVVGDVWLCSGQSNMAMNLGSCGRQVDIDAANYPGLRHFWVSLAVVGSPATNLTGSWSVCSPATAAGFSAAAFYFARKIYLDQNTNLPIGLIVSSVGGTRIDPWLAPEGCADIPVLAPLFSQSIPNYGPFSLFFGMIHPVAPFPVKGAIWYQGENGETTVQSADSYYLKMKALAAGWKWFLGLDDFPFYFVQIANYGAQPANATPVLFSGSWDANTRLQQANAMALPHAGMASAIDIGASADYHPTDKLDVGERLALWALRNEYGHAGLETSGPILRDVVVSGNKAICSFDHLGSGLMVGLKRPYQPTVETNLPLALFSIAGADGVWSWATATIVGNTVELTSPTVAVPAKIAYACWQNPLGANLYNREGLPASPFYVDDLGPRFTIMAAAGPGGQISPAGSASYLKRKTALYTITPEPGFFVQDVRVDDVSVGSVSSYTFDPLYANHSITATFTNVPPSYILNVLTGPGGTVSPAGAVDVVQGGSQTFAIAPNPGCVLALAVDGQPVGARSSFNFVDVHADHTLSAAFSCTVKASAGSGGKIVPSGTLLVPAGTSQTFTITPNAWYQVFNVQLDGVPQGPLTTLTLTNIATSHTIGVGFTLLPPSLTLVPAAGAGFDIVWPDVYSDTLLTSPVLGVGAVWTPVTGGPVHDGNVYRFTVTPTGTNAFYGLGH